MDYELAGGSNAVSVSSGPLYFSSHASAVLPAQPFPSRELGRSLVSTFTAPFYKYRQRLNPDPAMPLRECKSRQFNSLANDRSGKNLPSCVPQPNSIAILYAALHGHRQDEW